MIERPRLLGIIEERLESSPVVALLGPRQCGKTTLARLIAQKKQSEYFDLEDPVDRRRLGAPKFVLDGLDKLVIIDEIQRMPSLFEIIRVLADKPAVRQKFLILGSASPGLVRGVSETLAGRISFVEMGGFNIDECGAGHFKRLWLRGGFPRSFLAKSDNQSRLWRDDFTRSFLERDIPQLGITIPSSALRRFWVMAAHYHGQIWNAAEFARSLGTSEPTARKYLDILCGSYVVRALHPWHANISKRQVKSPKIYIRDSGLLHALLSIENFTDLTGNPKYGASWEGFAIEQVLSILNPRESYFWSSHGGAEIDLLVRSGGRFVGFEFTCADAPNITKSIEIAMEDLNLKKVFIIYPGGKSYSLSPAVEVTAFENVVKSLKGIPRDID